MRRARRHSEGRCPRGMLYGFVKRREKGQIRLSEGGRYDGVWEESADRRT